MNYVQGAGIESHGEYHFGLKIHVSLERELTEEDKNLMAEAVRDLEDKLMRVTVSLDPESKKRTDAQRVQLLGVFDGIYLHAVAIPNGYCSRWCCSHLPWYVVHTKVGPITIGWRKRVIEIDWEDCAAGRVGIGVKGIDVKSIIKDAATLFPDENVTKGPYMIHAYGADKAKEYVMKIVGAVHGV